MPIAFDNVFWLSALLVLPLFALRKRGRDTCAKYYSAAIATPFLSWEKVLGSLPTTMKILTFLFVIVGLANPIVISQNKTTRPIPNQIFVSIDTSGSMISSNVGGRDELYCTNTELEYTKGAERVYSSCQGLYRLIDIVSQRANKEGVDSYDIIGLVRFADLAQILTPPSTAYTRLRYVIDTMNWRDTDSVGNGTNVHMAMYAMIRLSLLRNLRASDGLVPLTEQDMSLIDNSFEPTGFGSNYIFPEELAGVVDALREELRDTTFVIITDTEFGQVESSFNFGPTAMYKMLRFLSFMETPVYIISTTSDNELVRNLAQETGYEEDGMSYRGDLIIADRGDNYKALSDIVEHILKKRFDRTIEEVREDAKSYQWHCAILAFLCFAAYIVLTTIITATLTRS